MQDHDVLFVIPALNEEGNLPAVIQELRASWPEARLLVVSDASVDGTVRVAREQGAQAVTLPFHLGYGGAVQTGIKHGLRRGVRVVVTFDADGQHDPADVGPLVAAVREGADVAIGSRALVAGSYRGGIARQWGRGLFGLLARLLTGLKITDPTSGLKALGPRGQELFALSRFPDRYPDADALVLARRARLVVVERPARMRPSRNRKSMHGGIRSVPYTFNMLFSLLVAATGRELDLPEVIVPTRQVVVFLALALLLLAVILELVRRRTLRIEYSWLWIASCLTTIVLILRYDLLVELTGLVGAVVPTSTLFFLCILYLALLCLHYSIRISHLTHRVKDLAQEVALLRAHVEGPTTLPLEPGVPGRG